MPTANTSFTLTKEELHALASLIVFEHHSLSFIFEDESAEQEHLYSAYLSLVNKVDKELGIKGTKGYKEAEKRNALRSAS